MGWSLDNNIDGCLLQLLLVIYTIALFFYLFRCAMAMSSSFAWLSVFHLILIVFSVGLDKVRVTF